MTIEFDFRNGPPPAPPLGSWASPERAAPSIKHGVSMSGACAALEAQAQSTTREMVKIRARIYAVWPCELDAICEGLSMLRPGHLVGCLSKLRIPHHRYLGYGHAINLAAAMLYARYSRAKAHKIARRAS